MHSFICTKNFKCLGFLSLFFVLITNCVSRQIPIPKDRLIQKSFSIQSKSHKEIPYLLYLPNAYYKGQKNKLPIVVFLHGRGERGNDINLLKRQALPRMISEDNVDFPFILLAPQLSEFEEEWYTKDLITLLEEVEDEYSVDKSRIYLTGISLGGNGVWKLATEFPEKFAAVVPISGWGEVSQVCRLKDTNVWAFHGSKDTLILPQKTIEIVERLRYCNPNVKSTIYPNTNHDAWTQTYKDSNFIKWLLEQRKNENKVDKLNQTKPIHTKHNPLKIIVIGDSVGISISWGLNEFVEHNYHLTLNNFAKVSTGLSYPKSYNWHLKLEEFLSQKKYDLGIVLIGANDTQSMTTDTSNLSFRTENWKIEYKERIKAIVEKFQKAKMNLYWIELPPMGPEKYHIDTRFLNSCFKEVADELKFSYISTTHVLGDEKGNYQKYLPYLGRRSLMRADDDIHLTVAGAKKITDELLKKIFEDYHFPE